MEQKANHVSNSEQLKQRLCGYGLTILDKIESIFKTSSGLEKETQRSIFSRYAYNILIIVMLMLIVTAVVLGSMIAITHLSVNWLKSLLMQDTVVSNNITDQCLNILWPKTA